MSFLVGFPIKCCKGNAFLMKAVKERQNTCHAALFFYGEWGEKKAPAQSPGLRQLLGECGQSGIPLFGNMSNYFQFFAYFDESVHAFVEVCFFMPSRQLHADACLAFRNYGVVESGYVDAFFLHPGSEFL